MKAFEDKQIYLLNLVREIVTYLPDNWRFNQIAADKNKEAQLIGDSGSKVFFRYRQDKKAMLTVTGIWPKIEGDRYYCNVSDWGVIGSDERYPTINISINRKPSVIANDLKSRFLTNYTRLYKLCLDRRELVLSRRQLISNHIETMKKVAPIKLSNHRHNPDNPRLYVPQFQDSSPYGELYFNSQSSCDFELNGVPYDTAIKILALISQDIIKVRHENTTI